MTIALAEVDAPIPIDAAETRPGWLLGGRIPGLDGLRAVAILMVLAHHEFPRLGIARTGLARVVEFALGTIGVQCFFAISGFLITTLLLRERSRTGGNDLGDFYRRRALRIIPAYLAYLAALVVVARLGAIRPTPGDWLAALSYTVNYVDHPTWEFAHIWTLSLEEQFYLIWPLAISGLGPRRCRSGLPAFLALAPVLRVAARVWLRDYPALGYQSTLTGMDSIAAGCLLALWAFDPKPAIGPRLTCRGFRNLGLAAGIALAGSVGLCGRLPAYHLALGRTINAAALALLIWSLTNLGDSPTGRFLRWRPLAAVGHLSYSLYLWQQLFLNPTRADWPCRWPQNLILAFLAATGSYLAIERPFLRLRRGPGSCRGDRHAWPVGRELSA